jgi:hypothetical protein
VVKSARQATAPVASEAVDEAAESEAAPATQTDIIIASAKPAAQVVAAPLAAVVAAPAPASAPAAPLARSTDIEPVSLSAPGVERAASTQAPDAPGAKAVATTASAPAEAATKAQAAVHAAAAGPDIKIEAAAASTSASTPALATPGAVTADTARAVATPAALQSAPAAAIQVYSQMIERMDGRAQRFEVRLDPVELGRVNVRIEVGADKKVHAVLAAHDSAALTDLMRGQRSLERAFADAGIDLADGGIKFELSSDTGRNLADNRGQGDANSSADLAHAWRGFSTLNVPVDAETAAAASRSQPWRTQRLDLVA